MVFLAALFISAVILGGNVWAQAIGSPIKALYGFSTKHWAFRNKTPGQMVQTLEQWGITAVFGGHEDQSLVAVLHARGIRTFAEVSLFVGKRYWVRYPQSRPILSTGEPMPPEGWYYGVNPVIPEIQAQNLEKIRQLIGRFPLDGVWLDFIRWPCRWDKPNPRLPQTSFDPLTLESFQRDTGIIVPPVLDSIPDRARWILRNHREEWTDWKCRQITQFVQQVREILKGVSRKILLGLFAVPWRSNDFDEAIRHVIGQDYRALSTHVDVFSPMAYHKLCGKDVPWIARISQWAWEETDKPIWPIVQAVDEPEPLSPQEFRQVLRTALAAPGVDGAIIFNLRALSREKIRVMKEVFGGRVGH